MKKAGLGVWMVRLSLTAVLLLGGLISWLFFIPLITDPRQKQGYDLADPAPFQMQVEALQSGSYTVRLEYYFDETEKDARRKLWQAIGGARHSAPGQLDEPGAPFDVRITLARPQSSKPVVADYVVHPKLSAWGAGLLRSKILETPLEKGIYILTVQRVGPVTDLGNTQVSVSFDKTWYK